MVGVHAGQGYRIYPAYPTYQQHLQQTIAIEDDTESSTRALIKHLKHKTHRWVMILVVQSLLNVFLEKDR